MKISIRQKLLLFSFIILAGNGFIGFAAYKSDQNLHDSEQWVRHTEEVIYKSDNILSFAKDMETASRGFVITNDSSFLEPLYTAEKTAFIYIEQLRQLTQDNPSQQQRVDSLNYHMRRRLDFSLRTVAVRSKQGLASAIASVSSKQGKVYTDRLRLITNDIQQEEATLLQQRKQTNELSVAAFNRLSVGIFILMAVSSILLLVATGNYMVQYKEKEKHAAALTIANQELSFQNDDKEKRAAELIIANRELKKAEEQFRLVVESSPIAMVLANHEGFITLVNNRTEQLFGYQRNELIGNKLATLIPERFREYTDLKEASFKKPLTPAISPGRDADIFAVKKNGTEIQVEIGIVPIETAEGHMVLASINDITERKIQEAAHKRQMELEIKNKELEQFAYIASHDLQEPLRTVSNYIQVIEEDYSQVLDENAHHYLQSVNSATKRMSSLIKSLLEFSRLGHNTKLTRVDFNKLINDVIADLNTVIKTSNAIIEVTPMPELNAYETEIRQVFQNLITNAIKFQKKDIQPNIRISSEKINGKWKFSVSDNGIGIAPAHFEHVFDIFQRLHTQEEYAGNGIGLANCKKIVQLHHGEIDIESTLGQGTTFHFTLENLTA